MRKWRPSAGDVVVASVIQFSQKLRRLTSVEHLAVYCTLASGQVLGEHFTKHIGGGAERALLSAADGTERSRKLLLGELPHLLAGYV